MQKYSDSAVSHPLEVKLSGDDMDVLQIGVFAYELHRVLNQAAVSLLQEADQDKIRKGEPKILTYIPQTLGRDDALVRARVTAVREGSLILVLQAMLSSIFSVPGAQAILQNLVASLIWSISTYAKMIPGIRITYTAPRSSTARYVPPTSVHKRMRPRVERLVKHLAESSNGGKVEFRSGDEVLIIEFYPDNGRKND